MPSPTVFQARKAEVIHAMDFQGRTDLSYYLNTMMPDEITVNGVINGHRAFVDERIYKFYEDFDEMKEFGKYCIRITKIMFGEKIRELVESFIKNFDESARMYRAMNDLLELAPSQDWPVWVVEGLVTVQNELLRRQNDDDNMNALKFDRTISPGTVTGQQCQNVANDFFWQRMWDSEDLPAAVGRLIRQGQERRKKAERATNLPEPMRKIFVDSREKGLSCNVLRRMCHVTPGSRQEILLKNALLFEFEGRDII